MAPPRKRKATAMDVIEIEIDDDGASVEESTPVTSQHKEEANEMEEQLCVHATTVYNDFVRFFQRRSSQQIAANRMFIVRHKAFAAKMRHSYPTAASLPYHHAMQNISFVETSEPPLPPHEDVSEWRKTTLHNPNENVTLQKQAVILPRIPTTPNATMWTALSKNYEVEDEPQLKFLPYFGDDDEDDVVSEFYQIKLQGTSAMEVEFTKEMCEAVLGQLQSTWELSLADLTRVAKAIDVEPEVVVEVHKKMRAAHKRAKKQKRMREAAENLKMKQDSGAAVDGDAAPKDAQAINLENMEECFEWYSTAGDSFRSLFCRRCYKYDCDYHGCVEGPGLSITEQNAVAEKIRKKSSTANTGRNCGNQCFLGRMGSSATTQFSKSGAISAAFHWDRQARIAGARAYFICSGNFCDIAKMMGNKTCAEVAEFCDFYEINEISMAEERKLQWKPRRSRKKKMAPSTSHLQQIRSQLLDGVSTKIVPCAHAGPCEPSECSCIAEGVFCSKLCNCVHADCHIFYNGCRCAKGRCRTKACPCFAAGRECDLDLCTMCCAEEIAALSDSSASGNTPSADTSGVSAPAMKPAPSASAPAQPTSCQNRNMTLRKTKRMRLARSINEDAGWGLFVDEFVAKDEFLIEYIGEMVSHEEAERRGAIYDKLNRSYLFNLDSGTVVDSTRKGNKTRFINHSSKPNCFAKIMNVNSDFRIGLYALQDLEPHTELFFDYRYDQEFHNVNLHKQPTVTEWMKEVKDSRDAARKKSAAPQKS
uniref:Uncharacterized protein n=1 Tax=Globisporangium ultimum (strain ATCC 200006 / CBS 805.95 / DAOM BR144) TaxID=431595 RepID=K3X6N2_GLOUD